MSERTILCVDDEANILSSLKRLFRNEDYKLLTAMSAKDGLSVLENQPVHVVISDYMMPGMTGTEFLYAVKQRFPNTVRVILSGYADLQAVLEAINKGAVFRFLTKPWGDEELKVSVRQCLAQYDLIQQNHDLISQIKSQNEEMNKLNNHLQKVVERQKQSLELFRGMSEQIPVPIIGINQEGTIIFVTKKVTEVFPLLSKVTSGDDVKGSLPPPIVEALKDKLGGSTPVAPLQFHHDGQQFYLPTTPLKERRALSGYILVLKSS